MRKLVSVLATLALLAHPTFALGASAGPSLTVADVVAGYETAVHLTGADPSQALSLHVISPAGEDTTIPLMTDATGDSRTSIPSQLTAAAGTYRVFAVSGQQIVTPQVTFDVLSDRVDPNVSTMTTSDATLAADGHSSAIVTVMLQDGQGNALGGRPVQLVGSRAEDRITPLTSGKETDATGRMQFAVQTQTPGDILLRAMDLLSGTMLNAVAHITATGGDQGAVGGFQSPYAAQVSGSNNVVDHFEITISTQTVKARDVIPLVTIKAEDNGGNVVESYTGDATMTAPDDPHATLPGLPPSEGLVHFTAKNRGVVTLPWAVSFSKAGTQTLAIADTTGTVRGQVQVTVTGIGEIPDAMKIHMESPLDGDTVGSREILLKGTGPALANLKAWVKDGSTAPEHVTDGDPAATGETGSDGSFAFTVKLTSAAQNIIDIQDESGQHDSGLIHVTVDTQGPTLNYAFDPPSPEEGGDVTLTVKSEPGMQDVSLKIKDQTIALTEGDPGTYQVLFQAPKRGDVPFTISATDAAGNATNMPGTLTITGPTLPQVQNVKADPLAGGIQLSWDAVPDPTITSYRIEVGKDPGHVDTTLDTPEASNSAAVMGLKAGTDYFITVRVLRDKEAGPKSDSVTARTLGMELTATPEDASLLLQWSFPDATPLSSFILEYGSSDTDLSEKRTLDGAMRVFTLKDLLPQSYTIRLTPIATTGNILNDLAVTTQATPLSSGAFHASASDIGPGNTVPPSNTLHQGAPQVPSSGMPAIPLPLVGALTLIVIALYLWRRRKAARETQAFLAAMQKRYHS